MTGALVGVGAILAIGVSTLLSFLATPILTRLLGPL